MSEEQTKYEVAPLPVITQKEIDDFLFASNTKLTEPQKKMFFEMAKAFSLNPFKREIYAIPYGDRFNIITGYEVYLKRAERTGQLDGWEADYVSHGSGDYAFCTIHRKDQRFPVTQKVWLAEFTQQNRMWKEKPKTMLIKVAIATAFRRAFPEEVGGLPYTSDEMPTEAEVVKPKQEKEPPSKVAQFDKEMQKLINQLPASKQAPADKKLFLYVKFIADFNRILPEEVKAQCQDYSKFWSAFLDWVKANPVKTTETKPEGKEAPKVPEEGQGSVPDERPDETQINCPDSPSGFADLSVCRNDCIKAPDCQAWK